MRILLCLNRDLMSNLALNLLWPALDGHIIDLVLSKGVAPAAPRAPEIADWQRLEHEIVEGGLFPLLNAWGDGNAFQSFEQRARFSQSGTPLQFANINRDDGLDHVRRFEPDLIVSIRFGQIFKPPLFALPRYGILNLHSGILPDYRGVLTTFWAMLDGAKDVGCTLHYVNDGTIDAGPVAGIHSLPMDRQRSLLWNVASLYPGGAEMITDALLRLSRGAPIAAQHQNAGDGRFFSYPIREQMTRFCALGYKLYARDDYAAILGRYGLSSAETANILSKLPC